MAARPSVNFALALTFAVTAIEAVAVCCAKTGEDPSKRTAVATAPLQTAFFMTRALEMITVIAVNVR
jgi:hypothetical protein